MSASLNDAEEAQWLLKPDAHVVPFNLAPLVAWTLFHGLSKKFVDTDSEQAHALVRVRRMLAQDLEQSDGWWVRVKSSRGT